MKYKNKSKALAAIHETVTDMFRAGVMDEKAMLEFDELCLAPEMASRLDAIRARRSKARLASLARRSSESLHADG